MIIKTKEWMNGFAVGTETDNDGYYLDETLNLFQEIYDCSLIASDCDTLLFRENIK